MISRVLRRRAAGPWGPSGKTDEIALGVAEPGRPPDRRNGHLPIHDRPTGVLHTDQGTINVLDPDIHHDTLGRLRPRGERALRSPFGLRAGGHGPVVDRTPLRNGPAEHAAVEHARPIGVIDRDLEMHHPARHGPHHVPRTRLPVRAFRHRHPRMPDPSPAGAPRSRSTDVTDLLKGDPLRGPSLTQTASSPLRDGHDQAAGWTSKTPAWSVISVSHGQVRVQAATSRRRNPATPITARTAIVPTATSTAGTDRPFTIGSCPAY